MDPYCISPKVSHAQAVKRICRYLLGTKDKGLIFDPKEPEQGLLSNVEGGANVAAPVVNLSAVPAVTTLTDVVQLVLQLMLGKVQPKARVRQRRKHLKVV